MSSATSQLVRRIALAALLTALIGPVRAQTISASLSGEVVDIQKTSVPNAAVTATDPEKNAVYRTTTDPLGRFVFAQIAPGRYAIQVEAVGFKTYRRAELTLNANDKLSLGEIVMQIGEVTESVVVGAEAPLLKTESAERSEALVSKQMQNIQVNGRSPIDLTKLLPGVVSTANFEVGGNGGLGNIQVNGNRGTMNQYTINGISDVDTGANNSFNVTLSLDSISEFKMLASSYQAEYGRSAGAQVSMVTKSGTEQFHGSGYWYHRHEGLNANTWLNNRNGLSRALYRYNDPGYTIGGPVWIPKILPQLRHELFFFWSQEFQQQLSPVAAKNVTLPTGLERTGDFSQSVDQNGARLTIKDPATGQPFPNNVIPANRLYSPGLALLKLYPLPNVAGAKGYNYTSQVSGELPRREDLLRLDYNPTSSLHLFGHFINNTQHNDTVYGGGPSTFGNNVPVTVILHPTMSNSYAGGATAILSPTMTNEFNFGMTHNAIHYNAATDALTRTASGITLPLLYPAAVQQDYIPAVSFGGSHMANSPSYGTASVPFANYNTTIDLTDNVTKVWGAHILKAGLYVQRSRKDQTSSADSNGRYNFGDTTANPYDSGYGYSNTLLGVFQTFDQASSYLNGQYRYWNIEGFLQDTWKISRNVTLDYGLRVSWYQPQYDSSNSASTFLPEKWSAASMPRLYTPLLVNGVRSAYDAVTGQVLRAYAIGSEVPGTGDPYDGILQAGHGISQYLQPSQGPQFGPRFGLAWDVAGRQRIVVRTGGGIYYDRIQGNRTFDLIRNPPESVQPVLTYGYAQDIASGSALLAPPALYASDPTGKVPTTYNYTISIESRLPYGMVLDTAYVGTQGRHLQDSRNLNYVPYGAAFQAANQDATLVASNPTALAGNNALTVNFLRPYKGFSDILVYESAATSNYNAFQASLNRRSANGLFFGISYTWAKALTTVSADTTTIRSDQYFRQASYGPASFDRRQNLAANYVYYLPQMKHGASALRAIANGWQLSGVIQIYSGLPFTPGYSVSGASSVNITGSTTEGSRLQVLCDPRTGSSDPYNRLNASCFAAPRPGSLGLESGQNWLYNPGSISVDTSLLKEFVVKERFHFQLRLDAFNALNHTNFTGLNTTLNFNAYPTAAIASNATPYSSSGALVNVNGFGAVSSVGPGRVIQTLLRVQF